MLFAPAACCVTAGNLELFKRCYWCSLCMWDERQRLTRECTAVLTSALSPPLMPPASGLEESLFMKTAHLHLTLAMLKLYSASQRQAARQARSACWMPRLTTRLQW